MTMAQVIGKRLTQLREWRGLTQKQLADSARGVSARTISRLENGEGSPHRGTIERIETALDVEFGVLTGEKPIPADAGQPSAPAEEAAYQLNVRVDAAVRSAFELVAQRYRISVPKIAQLAPLLFVIIAEGSLQHRRKDLEELEAAFPRLGEFEGMMSELRSKFPHIPFPDLDWTDQDEAIKQEKASIERRDLFGQERFVPDWGEEGEDNPFEAYLKAQAAIARERELDRQLKAYARGEIAKRAAAAKPDATPAKIADMIEANLDKFIERYGPDWRAANRERVGGELAVNAVGRTTTDYRVCRSEAQGLAGDDAELAESLLKGEVPIHRMPRNLLRRDAVAERLKWMHDNKISVRSFEEPAPEELREPLIF